MVKLFLQRSVLLQRRWAARTRGGCTVLYCTVLYCTVLCYCSGAGRLAREAAAERPEPQLQQAGAARGRGERGPGDQVDSQR